MQTRILVPFGDQRGHSATLGRSWTWLVPSGFAVKIWKSPRSGLNLPNTIWPFGPGTFAWAGTVAVTPPSSAAAKIVTSVISRLIATTLHWGSRPDLWNIDGVSIAPRNGSGTGSGVLQSRGPPPEW